MRGKKRILIASCAVKLWVKIETVAFEMLNVKNFNSNNVDALIAKKKKEKKEAFSQTLKGKSINLIVIE